MTSINYDVAYFGPEVADGPEVVFIMVLLTKPNFSIICLIILQCCAEIDSRFVSRDIWTGPRRPYYSKQFKRDDQKVQEYPVATDTETTREIAGKEDEDVKVETQNEAKPSTVEPLTVGTKALAEQISRATKVQFGSGLSRQQTTAHRLTGSTAPSSPTEYDDDEYYDLTTAGDFTDQTTLATTGKTVKENINSYFWRSKFGSKLPKPNGLESDVDDPRDVIVHVQPCETTGKSCSSTNIHHQHGSDGLEKTPKENSVFRTGGKTGTEYIHDQATTANARLTSRKSYGVHDGTQENNHLPESTTKPIYDDAYF